MLKKALIYIIGFLLCLAGTFFLIYKNVDIDELNECLKNFNKIYFVIGLFIVPLFSLVESINVKRLLRFLNIKKSLINCYKYSIIGFFFSNITPSATGGQPAQIYYMDKDGIEPSHSVFVLCILLFCYQIVIEVYGLLGLLINYTSLKQILAERISLIYLALFINLCIIIFIDLMIFRIEIAKSIVQFIVNVTKKINGRLSKRLERRLDNFIKKYRHCSELLKNDKVILSKTLIGVGIQFFIWFSVPFIVYKGFGYQDNPLFKLIFLQGLLYVSCAFIPIPGALTIAEVLFLTFYSLVFPQNIISGAMLMTRTLNLYIPVIIYGVLTAIIFLRGTKRKAN